MYVAGRKLALSRDFNVGDPVPTAIPIQGGGSLTVDRFPTRPFTNFDRLVRFESTGRSNYNGGTLEIKKRWEAALANLAYTLSEVKDNNPDSVNVVSGRRRRALPPIRRTGTRLCGRTERRGTPGLQRYRNIDYFKDSGVREGPPQRRSRADRDCRQRLPVFGEDRQRRQQRRQPQQRPVPGSRDSQRLPGRRTSTCGSPAVSRWASSPPELIAEAFNLSTPRTSACRTATSTTSRTCHPRPTSPTRGPTSASTGDAG
jgi:hypothetical protein